MILCLLSFVSLVGCATTQTQNTTKKADTQQAQKSGSYLGGGIGVGVMSF
jgi:hypothetical protein